MSLVEHAKQELKIAGLFENDSDYSGHLGHAVLALIEVFANQDHSGYSANQTANLFNKLSRFEPLSPIEDIPEHWVEISKEVFQHKRCSRVFKENGVACDIEYYIFQDNDGFTYGNYKSRKEITFPYTPTQEIIQTGI